MPRLTHIILALGLLMIPARSFAMDVFPFNISIGGGPGMFSAGIDWAFALPLNSLIYKSAMRSNEWASTHEFWWTIRSRYIYDYDEKQQGVFLQPNVHYLLKLFLFDFALGPEIGWEKKTGFEYGGSVRTGFLSCAYIEFGYLVNSEKTYVNFLFNIPFGPFVDWTFNADTKPLIQSGNKP